MGASFALSWLFGLSTCWHGAPCDQTKPPQAQYSQQSVTVYRVPSHPAVAQANYDTIMNIGLTCEQKDTIIHYLEHNVGARGAQPEQLTDDQRRINAAARSKVWQLRTYCQ